MCIGSIVTFGAHEIQYFPFRSDRTLSYIWNVQKLNELRRMTIIGFDMRHILGEIIENVNQSMQNI